MAIVYRAGGRTGVRQVSDTPPTSQPQARGVGHPSDPGLPGCGGQTGVRPRGWDVRGSDTHPTPTRITVLSPNRRPITVPSVGD